MEPGVSLKTRSRNGRLTGWRATRSNSNAVARSIPARSEKDSIDRGAHFTSSGSSPMAEAHAAARRRAAGGFQRSDAVKLSVAAWSAAFDPVTKWLDGKLSGLAASAHDGSALVLPAMLFNQTR